MAFKVFVAHAQQDRKLVEIVKQELSSKGYLPLDAVYLDEEDGSPGENIRQRLRSKIGIADTVVLVMSKHAEESHWINYETGLADALGKSILVVREKGAEETRWLQCLPAYRQVEVESLG